MLNTTQLTRLSQQTYDGMAIARKVVLSRYSLYPLIQLETLKRMLNPAIIHVRSKNVSPKGTADRNAAFAPLVRYPLNESRLPFGISILLQELRKRVPQEIYASKSSDIIRHTPLTQTLGFCCPVDLTHLLSLP